MRLELALKEIPAANASIEVRVVLPRSGFACTVI